tara:strand:+ start:27238 stop:27423 length:186 start_codon:yes stop_codon:yes gene_type:complete
MKKREVISEHIAEKVKLTENLLLCYGTGVDPTPEEIARARELGIDVDGLAGVKGDDEASTY